MDSKLATISAQRLRPVGRRAGVGAAWPHLLRILLVLVLACAVQPAAPMAWGAKAGAADWCRRLRENDKALASLLVMRTRAMATTDWVDFCVALGDNKELKELKASSHKLDALALAAFR